MIDVTLEKVDARDVDARGSIRARPTPVTPTVFIFNNSTLPQE